MSRLSKQQPALLCYYLTIYNISSVNPSPMQEVQPSKAAHPVNSQWTYFKLYGIKDDTRMQL
jgi:hypothetical protein